MRRFCQKIMVDAPDNIICCTKGNEATVPDDTGIIRLDAEQVIVSLGESASKLMGIPPETLLGRKLDEFVDLSNLSNLIKNGISFSNQVIVIGDRHIICDYVPIVEDDWITGGALSLIRLLPEGADTSSDDLNEIIRSTNIFMNVDHDGIIIIDRKGIVLMVNQSFARLFNTTPQAMIGKHVSKAYINSQPSGLTSVMESGKPEIGITHYFNGKQVYASRYPLIKDGKVIGCMGKVLFKDLREITLIANRLQTKAETRKQRQDMTGSRSLFKYDVNSIVGQSRKIIEMKETLLRVAQKSSNVLLRGESGTGKELFAHAIHAASNRRYAPFIKVNCAAIPEHLLESELFGYAEGAFTGARKGGQIGKFEQAHTGTIFLDEIGDMPLYMQAKMLRVLQDKELTQLGSTQPKTIDARVVAATNSNLEQRVREGKFREDLYYRLNVVIFTIPPLRERMEDIHAITQSFIDQFNAEFDLDVQGLDDDVWEIIKHYDWPGNIRELRNVIESAFNTVIGPVIKREHLPEQLLQLLPPSAARPGYAMEQGIKDFIRSNLGNRDLNQLMDDFEKTLVETAVELSHDNKQHAARLLGISRQWLYKKIQKYSGEGGSNG